MVKTQGNLFFIWVPPFDKFRKNLILSRLWVYQLFKVRTPDSFLKLPRILSVCIQGNETGSLEKFGMEQCSLCPGSCWSCPSLAWALPGSTGNSGTALAPAGLMGTKPSARINFCTQEFLTENFFNKLLREPDPSLCGVNSEDPASLQWGRVDFSICAVLREYWGKDWQAWQLQNCGVWKMELYECLFSL